SPHEVRALARAIILCEEIKMNEIETKQPIEGGQSISPTFVSSTRVLLNGTDKPEPLSFKVGQTYRFRFIHLEAHLGHLALLQKDGRDMSWTLIAKDGIALPKEQQTAVPSSQPTFPGETYDFEFKPPSPGDYLLIVKRPSDPPITQLLKVRD